MSRTRNLKPSFFKNEDLAELGPYAMILFEGLWCLADRRGRLEDRPKRLKIETLPYFDCDCNELLKALHNGQFIIRYEVDGNRYIQIKNFEKHQNPHRDEKESSIPAPSELAPNEHPMNTVQAPRSDAASAELAPSEHITNRANYFNLVTNSLKPKTNIKNLSSETPMALSDEDGEGSKPENPKPKPAKRVYDHDCNYYKAAVWLAKSIIDATPEVKPKSEKELQNWADTARKIIEIDKRDENLTNQLLLFCRKDAFWSQNILGMDTFRKQYDKLLVKFKANPTQQPRASPSNPYADYPSLTGG